METLDIKEDKRDSKFSKIVGDSKRNKEPSNSFEDKYTQDKQQELLFHWPQTFSIEGPKEQSQRQTLAV